MRTHTRLDYPSGHATLSLVPLIRFWQEKIIARFPGMATAFEQMMKTMPVAFESDIHDTGVLKDHRESLDALMSAVVPPASYEKEMMAAFIPCSFKSFYATPEFERLFLDPSGCLGQTLKNELTFHSNKKPLKPYHLVLNRIYDFPCPFLTTGDVRTLVEEATGLTKYYEDSYDHQFVDLVPLAPPKPLNDEDRRQIMAHLTDVDLLNQFINLDQYEFKGFVISRIQDVTPKEIISALERDLVDENSVFSSQGIQLLESRLQSLFKKPDLGVAIAALQENQVMITKNDHHSKINCLFANSHHIPLADLQDSVWAKAAHEASVLRVPDLSAKTPLNPNEQVAVTAGIRSMLLSPLYYQGEKIGLLEIYSPYPNDLSSFDAILMEQISPLFAVALKRGLDEVGKHVQRVIKEQCTAVHPSVEWRFEKEAMAHLERVRKGDTDSKMKDIVFKDVIPFYGASDIRGSSKARNQGIQQDMTRQLSMARDIMAAAALERPWPLLNEYAKRIDSLTCKIDQGVTSNDENTVFSLLNHEVLPTFGSLTGISSEIDRMIDQYNQATDPVTGMIHDKRKDYEDSVAALNTVLSNFLEREDAKVQASFPHYFEKRQTDGVDYMMYIGGSMTPDGRLSGFHVKDMTLWQIMTACGLAVHAERIKPDLKIELSTCHLILVNHTPLSIRFRYDEKRFDVDSAYNTRQEIIKSRLDKALVKGSGQRLTQPGKIALVYSSPGEGKQIRQHLEYLAGLGKTKKEIESFDIEDLPDVRGLKAMRVTVNTESGLAKNIIPIRA